MAWISSRRLWGGIWVVIPTEIPHAPLANTCGNRTGSTSGSWRESSKLGTKSTVSSASSSRNSMAMGERRASV